ncbi:MAG: cation transporter [Azonexus sp.]|nr:cation transporter [Azonexus sp.]MCK6411004.1 cation transporter [Azonexus sp.]
MVGHASPSLPSALASLSGATPGAVDLAALMPRIATYLAIAHQIPGRIRFKIDAGVLKDPALQALGDRGLSDALGVIPGVREIRINKLARSCTVEYDGTIIPDIAWSDLLAGRRTAAAATLLGIIENKYDEVCHGQSR